jgi:hypothetical protein
MVMDSNNRLILLTNHTKNNILIYNTKGDIVESWTLGLKTAHGLTINKEGEEEYLYICDPQAARVIKTTLKGKVIMELKPPLAGVYKNPAAYFPTETAIAPNGDIYVADAYGASCIIQYDKNGKYMRQFGGAGNSKEALNESHGIAIDYRTETPTLLATSRKDCAFKRFTLTGEYLETIKIPGAYVCRPVIKNNNLYAGVCWSDKYLKLNSGFVTVLDKNNKVVSNPGGTSPKDSKIAKQDKPLFSHCHDVCIDDAGNIYVAQWNAGGVYPIKLEKV